MVFRFNIILFLNYQTETNSNVVDEKKNGNTMLNINKLFIVIVTILRYSVFGMGLQTPFVLHRHGLLYLWDFGWHLSEVKTCSYKETPGFSQLSFTSLILQHGELNNGELPSNLPVLLSGLWTERGRFCLHRTGMMLQTLHQCDAAPQNCSVCGRDSVTLLQGRNDTAVSFSSRARACPEPPSPRRTRDLTKTLPRAGVCFCIFFMQQLGWSWTVMLASLGEFFYTVTVWRRLGFFVLRQSLPLLR